MKNIFFSNLPMDNLTLETTAIKNFPAIANAYSYSSEDATGGSTGNTQVAAQGALGELMERTYFYGYKQNLKKISLQALPLPIAKVWLNYIQQLNPTMEKQKILTHAFSMSQVFGLADTKTYYIPSATFCLLDYALQEDIEFFPYRDSCGQAGHTEISSVYKNALLEFYERQSLMASWLSSSCRFRIDLDNISNLSVFYTLKQLQSSGEVFLFDLGHKIPGYPILSLYRSNHSDEKVKYSAGLASAITAKAAIEKSILELWLSYNFMYLYSEKANKFQHPSKQYHYNFLKSNTPETINRFSFFKNYETKITLTEYLSQESISLGQLEKEFLKISPYIFWFTKSQRINNDLHFYGKIISPDFFAHMNPCQNLNLKNAYSKYLNLDLTCVNKNAIPFP